MTMLDGECPPKSNKDVVEFVDIQGPLSFWVGRFLISGGFFISPLQVVKHNLPFSGSYIYVFYRDPNTKPKTYLFGLIKKYPLTIFLGRILFEGYGATKDNWIFELYGRENVDLIRQLAQKMMSSFNEKFGTNARIIIQLQSEGLRFAD